MPTYEETCELSGVALEQAVDAFFVKSGMHVAIKRWTRDPRAILYEVEMFIEFQRAIRQEEASLCIEYTGYQQWCATITGKGWFCEAEGTTLAEALCRAFIQECDA